MGTGISRRRSASAAPAMYAVLDAVIRYEVHAASHRRDGEFLDLPDIRYPSQHHHLLSFVIESGEQAFEVLTFLSGQPFAHDLSV
jgi:hypothetical protein